MDALLKISLPLLANTKYTGFFNFSNNSVKNKWEKLNLINYFGKHLINHFALYNGYLNNLTSTSNGFSKYSPRP